MPKYEVIYGKKKVWYCAILQKNVVTTPVLLLHLVPHKGLIITIIIKLPTNISWIIEKIMGISPSNLWRIIIYKL